MNYFLPNTKIKDAIETIQQIQVEQKSIYALEHMLGYHIKELEELRPHQRNIKFIAEANYQEQPDLVDLSYWLERIDNIKVSIKKNEKIITRLYDRLYAQIILKILEGKELNPLDIFFYKSKKYIEKVRSGKITFQELVAHYDWQKERFNDLE